MANVPGSKCAAKLFSVGLPFQAVVRSLTDELGLTFDEATRAALDAEPARGMCVG